MLDFHGLVNWRKTRSCLCVVVFIVDIVVVAIYVLGFENKT